MASVKQKILPVMADAVAAVLPTFDERTGRFMSKLSGPPAPGAKPEDIGWGVINQDVIYPLAVLYTTPGTRFHGDRAILNMALRGGDAIRDFQYPDGQVEFLKVDGSRWGPIYMCWTNYAWLEAYALLREELGDARRRRWEEGLTLAHDGQARESRRLSWVHNIPCWKAMSCWRAGQIFGRPDWQEAGTGMIRAVVAEQKPGGYWDEHGGPTTLYNHVYMHGLGLYYNFTGDASLLPALEAATDFHQTFLYPSGAGVETVDGRVSYHDTIATMAWVGFSATPQGRRLVRYLAERLDAKRDVGFQGGSIASSVQHLIEGDEAPINLDQPSFRKPYRDWAIVGREGPWFACLSAFACPPVDARWGMDRQSFLSLWHERFGLVLGGGNSKDQADWSSFEAAGRFMPGKGELLPDGAGVALTYGPVRCLLRLRFEGGKAIIEGASEGGPARQQFVVQAKPGYTVRSATGLDAKLGAGSVNWDTQQLGAWIEVNACRITVPHGASFRWPLVAFNPYAADGAAPFGAERGVLSARIDGKPILWEIQMKQEA